MRASRRIRLRAAAIAAACAALVPAACGGAYSLPTPPTATPQWPPGVSALPAVSYPAQDATTRGLVAGSEGWAFRPTTDIEVTALGYYDDGRDGLLHAHRTAIFDDATGQAVVQTTVLAESPLDGPFRWERVTPVVLTSGREYVMASSGERPFDPQVLCPKDASVAPQICFLCSRRTAGGPAWGCPDASASDVFLAGNFKYRPASPAGPADR